MPGVKTAPRWKGRLAVVDDDPTVLSLVNSSFKELENDVKLTLFDNTKDFIKEHEQKPFDGVLLDYSINGIPRNELISRIDKANRAVNIILMSGYFDKINESSVVIAKPFENIVEQVLGRMEKLSTKLPFTKEVLISMVLGCLGRVISV